MQEDLKNFDRGKLPYRQAVIGVIVDSLNNFLLIQSVYYNEGEWRFAGGEVKEGEDLGTALMRGVEEELGTRNFEIVAKSTFKKQYEWPENVIKRHYQKSNLMFRGQVQSQYLLRFKGKPSEIIPNPDEIREVKWVSLEELPEHFIFPKQWEEAKKVIEELLI